MHSDGIAYLRRFVDSWAKARPDLDIEALETVSWIGHTARALETRVESAASAEGLKTGELTVLLALRRAPGLTASPTDLWRSLWVTSGGMTYRIDRLVGRGLVRRRTNPADRRSMQIELSPAGLALADRVQTLINALEVQAVAELEPGERAELVRLMQKVHSGLAQGAPSERTAAG